MARPIQGSGRIARTQSAKDGIKPRSSRTCCSPKRLADLARQYSNRFIEQAEELEQKYRDPATSDQHKERINSYLNLREQHADHYRDLVATNDPEIRDPDIVNAQHRFGKVSARHFHIESPFESLATTDRVDYGTFNAQQKFRGEMIAIEKDAKGREILHTQKLIEAYEYLDRTARHIAIQSKEITGRPDNPESTSMTRAADGSADSEGYATRAFYLRKHYRELQPEPTIEHSFQKQAQDISERAPDRLDRIIEEQDRIARQRGRSPHRKAERAGARTVAGTRKRRSVFAERPADVGHTPQLARFRTRLKWARVSILC
jgi:hypothetical protein